MNKLFTMIFTAALAMGATATATQAEMTLTPAKIGARTNVAHAKKPAARLSSARIAPDNSYQRASAVGGDGHRHIH